MKFGGAPHMKPTVLSQLALALVLVTNLTLYPLTLVVIMAPRRFWAQEAEPPLAISLHIAHHL